MMLARSAKMLGSSFDWLRVLEYPASALQTKNPQIKRCCM
ncbi:hypothetical protein CABS03_06352 [Colletotrichum abscissum]|uniref:Uncharacterized protein n=1 Tax=Colletotrichum abscissum TaxID=1671311 RepID=A0A9Q0AUK6_9PEZI|nr:hypothetical protein CABS02_13320 [Colletotrichum abscissum]